MAMLRLIALSWVSESVRRNAGSSPGGFSGEWMILRHFYWVN
jgi:hypothetical protein